MVLVSLVFPVAAYSMTADDIVKKADLGRGLDTSFAMVVKVTDVNGNERQQSLFNVSVQDTNGSVIEQKAPERLRGRKLLMKDLDIWMFTPNIRRPVRMSMEQKLTGEVANGDLARTNFAQDYSATLVGEETINGKKLYRLKLSAKRPGVTYSKIDYWVDKSTYLPSHVQFYALSGKLLKSATYSDFKLIYGHQRMTKMVIVDAIQKTKQSLLIYSGHQKKKFGSGFFNKESLEQ